MKRFSKKTLIIVSVIVVALVSGYFVWQHFKYKIARTALKDSITNTTDSLYHIRYDSLHFDEVAGNAYLKNVRVVADTGRARSMTIKELPSVLLDVKIESIKVTGINTAAALNGSKIVGDTVIINHPSILMYSIRPLQKNTRIETEARNVYEEILGKLNKIAFKYVLIDSINVKSVRFYSGKKNFDFLNGNIQLTDVLVDSAHYEDTSRILFCKKAAFTVDSFYSYNNNRKELEVSKVAFSGELRSIVFEQILLNRFENSNSEAKKLLEATALKFAGVNTNEIVKNKNLIVDSILCSNIKFYQPPAENLKNINTKSESPQNDSTGFRNVYSIGLAYLGFKEMNFIPYEKSRFDIGKMSLTIKNVLALKVADLEEDPLQHTKEVEVHISSLSAQSKDKQYRFGFSGLRVNSLSKTLYISSAGVSPSLSETAFANQFQFQKDRFDVSMSGIELRGIEMENLFNDKLIASQLTVQKTTAKIYRDLNKPLEKKSRVGNYPSQMLERLDFPVNIKKATLQSAYIQYREKEIASQETGKVSFHQTNMHINNITNIATEIKQDNALSIDFQTRVLNRIPLTGNFTFYLGDKNGAFSVRGKVSGFEADVLNQIAIPMALIKIRKGKINALDFDFKGNDHKASGPFTMKYENLKVDVLKKQDDSTLKKRGLISLVANIVVKNNNPDDGTLRKVMPEYDRDIYKSFFNLVWKTIFTGMKETVGLP